MKQPIREAKGVYLSKIDSHHFQDLYEDAILKSDGTDIFYIVDTYDIIEYCFPFYSQRESSEDIVEDIQKLDSETLEVLETKHLAYHHLFYEYPKKPIIPNEYLKELSSFKYHLKYDIDQSLNAYDSLKIFLRENKEKITAKDLNFFISRLNTILAISFDLLTPKAIDKFNDIVKTRLSIVDIDITSPEDKPIIIDIFNETNESCLTKKIYDEFYNRIKYKLLTSSPSTAQCFRYLDNSYRDIVVIDRCLNINKKVIESYNENHLKNKYLFLYLSSTPNKSEEFFRIKAISNNLKDYNNNKLNILRNSFQLYLKSIIEKNSIDNGLDFFKELHECAVEAENYKAKWGKATGRGIKYLMKEFVWQHGITRKQFFQTIQLQKFYDYKEKIERAITKLDGKKEEDFNYFIDILNKAINSNTLKSKAESCQEKLFLHTINYSTQGKILDFSRYVSQKSIEIVHVPGKDIVRSNYQHLPILPFTSKESKKLIDAKWSHFIQLITDYLSNPQKNKTEIKNTFIDAYNEVINIVNNHSEKTRSPFVSSIILTYLNLLVPKVRKKDGTLPDISDEKSVILRLESLRKIISLSHTRLIFNKTDNRFEKKQIPNVYISEINYLLIWLYRRQKRFQDSIDTANEELKKLPSDPRLIQGKALSLISEIYNSNDITAEKLKRIKEMLIKSINLFHSEFDQHNLLVKRTITALKNTICFVSIVIYKIKSDAKLLLMTEKYINEIEQELNDQDLKIEDLPAFCDTFVRYYLVKAKFLINQKKVGDALYYLHKVKKYLTILKNTWVYQGLDDELNILQKEYISLMELI